MHPAQCAAPGVEGHAGLRHLELESMLGELPLVVSAGEETPLVEDGLGLDSEHPRERHLLEGHGTSSSRGTGTTKRQPQFRTSAIWAVISSRRFHGSTSR